MTPYVNASLEGISDELLEQMSKADYAAHIAQLSKDNKFFQKLVKDFKKNPKVKDPERLAYYVGIRTGGWPKLKKSDSEKSGTKGGDEKKELKWGEIPGIARIKKGIGQIAQAFGGAGLAAKRAAVGKRGERPKRTKRKQ